VILNLTVPKNILKNKRKMSNFLSTGEYKNFLQNIKERIAIVRMRTMSAINNDLIKLYWYIGSQILAKQSAWGSKFLEKLSTDLHKQYKGAQGFSVTNLKRMRMLAETYPAGIGSQAVTQLPWGQVIVLLFSALENDDGN
jgi:predicted nuclease of restriction endonuclease-like (RecB) superfamily